MVSYWWVNQNQTFTHEVGGGYLWSPKTRADGGRNQFYENMTAVKPGDIVFSFSDTYIKAVGIALSEAFSASKPKIFGSTGQNWSQEGWQVDVEFTRVVSPIRPKEHISLLAPYLPEKYAPIQTNGNGLQGVYLAAVPSAMAHVLLDLVQAPELKVPVTNLDDLNFTSEEREIVSAPDLGETVKATLVMARRGQGVFRDRVSVLESSCRITGVSFEKLLIASHIKPWKLSTNAERLDGNNGLFLSPHVDRLFDSGFISFTQNGDLLVSEMLDDDVLPKWGIDPKKRYGRFNADQSYFLAHHQEVTFRHVSSFSSSH